jgi:NAD+ kinase
MNAAPRRLLILYYPQVDSSQTVAEAMRDFITRWPNCSVSVSALNGAEPVPHLADQEAVVVLGGDGSLLRASVLTAPHQVPMLGVNLGRLGFLTEAQPDEWPEVLTRVLAGDYWIESRMMLHIEHRRAGQCLGDYEALNEAVVGRGAFARPVHLKTLIDGGELTTYVADGLIIATPTGSTAYALATGGPILPPELRNILLIAIAPHLSLDRAIVLAQGVTVDVTVRADSEALLSTDGQTQVSLQDGDLIRVRMSDYVTRFIRVRPPTYFYSMLMARMTQNPAADKGR